MGSVGIDATGGSMLAWEAWRRRKKRRRMAEATWPGGWRPIRYEERCRMRREELDARVGVFVDRCREMPDVSAVFVFGSYARGDISPWSDVDVLVVRDAPADTRSGDLAADLYRNGGLDGDGDIVAVPTSRFPDGLQATPFGRTILTESVRIYARPA